DRRFAILRRSSPGLLSIAFFRISGLRQGFFPARKIYLSRIPDKSLGRGKGHVPAIVHFELLSQFAFLLRAADAWVVYLLRAYNINGFVALARLLHPVQLLFSKHFFGINQLPRAYHDMVIRNRNMILKITISQVKLTCSEVRLDVPSLHIIKYGHAG